MMRVLLIKSVRQIDERYGQFGSDADLATQIGAASKRISAAPHSTRSPSRQGYRYGIRTRRFPAGPRRIPGEVFRSFGAGLQARLAAVFGALLGFRFGELKYTLSGQKIDGTQE